MRAFFYAWSLAARFHLRVNQAHPCPSPQAETYRGPRSVARGPRSGDHCPSTRTRHRIATSRRPLDLILDPRSTGRGHLAGEIAPGGQDRRPEMLHQVSTRRAPGSQKPGIWPKQHGRNLLFLPARRTSKLGFWFWRRGQGPFRYRVKNPGNPPKMPRHPAAPRGPGDEGKGHVSHKYLCKI